MKKNIINHIFVIAALLSLSIIGASCAAQDDGLDLPEISKVPRYPSEIQTALEAVYNVCLAIWEDEIPQNIINDRISTIRYCDLLDSSGDILPEMDEYDVIKDIIWPLGYGKLE